MDADRTQSNMLVADTPAPRSDGALRRLLRRFRLWQCSRGNHAPLIWLGARERHTPIPLDTPRLNPTEAFYASGMGQFAKWNGWCPRCGLPVDWSTDDPLLTMRGRERFEAIQARNAYRKARKAGVV